MKKTLAGVYVILIMSYMLLMPVALLITKLLEALSVDLQPIKSPLFVGIGLATLLISAYMNDRLFHKNLRILGMTPMSWLHVALLFEFVVGKFI